MSDIFLNSEIKNKFNLESDDSVIPEWISIVDANKSTSNKDSFLNLFKKNIIENDNNDISVNSFNIDVINKKKNNSIFLKNDKKVSNKLNTDATSSYITNNIQNLSTTSEFSDNVTSSFIPNDIQLSETSNSLHNDNQLGGNNNILSESSVSDFNIQDGGSFIKTNTLSKKPSQQEIDKFISMLTTESDKDSENKDFDTVTSMTSTSVLEEKLNKVNNKQNGGAKKSKKSNKDIGERKLNPALQFWHKLLNAIKDKLNVKQPVAIKLGSIIQKKIKEDNPDADYEKISELSLKHLNNNVDELKKKAAEF